jgi:hypothetical protein
MALEHPELQLARDELDRVDVIDQAALVLEQVA